MSDIHQQPAEIQSITLKLFEVSQDLADLRTLIHRQELEAGVDIAEQRSADGKALYSNDNKRELATLRMLEANTLYKNNCQVAGQLERRKAELAVEIDRLRREHRIALIDYEVQTLGRREAA